jgi:virginiamycin B lyase
MTMFHSAPQVMRSVLVYATAAISLLAFTISAPAQTFQEFPIPTANTGTRNMTAGPDGNLWFAETATNKIGRITPAGVFTEFPIPTAKSAPFGIAAGPDGNLWFTEFSANKIGRITPAGVITDFDVPTPNSGAEYIAVGTDGNMWFTENFVNKIGRITPAGVITEFTIPTANAGPVTITSGPDGNLWFTQTNFNKISRITTAGVVTAFDIPTPNSNAFGITAGPDGNLWFAEKDGNKIGRITPAGVIMEFPLSAANSGPADITTGPDGALWFAEPGINKIGRITTAGTITEFPIPTPFSGPESVKTGPDGNVWFVEGNGSSNNIARLIPPTPTIPLLAATLPSSRSVQAGKAATAFATILNTGAAASACGIAPVTPFPAGFLFQTTDPNTNQLTGLPNVRVPIPAGGLQTYLVAFSANAPFVSTNVVLGFDCSSVDAVATIVGVNTLLLTFDANPVPDMIAVGLTPSNDGYSRIPGVNGTGIFVIAATDIGIAASLTARVKTLNATPLTATICETNPSGPQVGQCKAPPAPTVTRTINQNENTTWTAFLSATAPIAQDAARSRVFFEFVDANGIVRGSTSTAVTTN